jgi:Asp-tRNA(Asn)/Glu-tRNA(Gln) amidotransferase A subunit family amidase
MRVVASVALRHNRVDAHLARGVRVNFLTASEAAARIHAGTLRATALMESCLARIGAREREVGAWTCIDATAALEAARAADSTAPTGPLHGIPIGVKDIIDTVDFPTELGTALYAGRRPAWDASCVAACRAAGAIVLGKTVTTEFAFFHPGRTRNPRNLAHTPGGSSSGSAAAVADAMVPVALGTQTAGSVIRPAAFCGVVGYKASFGDFSLSGVRSFAESLDTLGVFATSVVDAVLLRGVLIGGDAPTALAPADSPPRFALCRTPQWDDADVASRECVENAGRRLSRAGAVIEEVALPAEFSTLIEDQRTIMSYEAARNYLHELTRFADRLSPQLRALLEQGMAIPRTRYRLARDAVAIARRRFTLLCEGHDALIVPATVGEAPLAAEGTGDPLMSRIWTALHGPALTLPAGAGVRGLPLGVQFVAPAGCDETLLRAAAWAQPILASV